MMVASSELQDVKITTNKVQKEARQVFCQHLACLTGTYASIKKCSRRRCRLKKICKCEGEW
jgi:hypothetical protein